LPHRVANAVLALWVLVASTCGAVAHAHDGGDRPHSHHFGLVSLRAPVSSGGLTRFAGLHRHLVVCGVETGNLPPDSDDGNSPAAPGDGPQVAVGFGTIQLVADNPSDAVQPAAPDAAFELPPVPEPAAPLSPRIDSALVSRFACAKALRTRSGVQLV
jgi:hypothetical protein